MEELWNPSKITQLGDRVEPRNPDARPFTFLGCCTLCLLIFCFSFLFLFPFLFSLSFLPLLSPFLLHSSISFLPSFFACFLPPLLASFHSFFFLSTMLGIKLRVCMLRYNPSNLIILPHPSLAKLCRLDSNFMHYHTSFHLFFHTIFCMSKASALSYPNPSAERKGNGNSVVVKKEASWGLVDHQ